MKFLVLEDLLELLTFITEILMDQSKISVCPKRTLWAVWPDLAIYWTLGICLKPLATIDLSKSPTFLGNFCKGVKLFNISSEIIFGQFYRHLATFYWSHCQQSNYGVQMVCHSGQHWTDTQAKHYFLHYLFDGHQSQVGPFAPNILGSNPNWTHHLWSPLFGLIGTLLVI